MRKKTHTFGDVISVLILILRIRDRGVGIPADIDIRNTNSLGLHLMTMLIERQLKGTVALQREAGTEWGIRFRSS